MEILGRGVSRKHQEKMKNSRSFLNREDIIAVCRLLYTEEEKLDQLKYKDWFDENAHIFTTCFWQLCQTVYGFQKTVVWESFADV